jgi:hypothetical protein
MNLLVELQSLYVTAARPLPSQRIEITTKSGATLVVDLLDLIAGRDIFWRLRQDRYFKMVKVDEQGVLCWPEGEDVAPESLGKYIITPGVAVP